jgi:hypothetical protein
MAVNLFAWNGYGAPRVPRAYCPSNRPSFSVASSFVSYSSKLRTSTPFSKLPVVEVSFSSPLKNEPLTAAPPPASSNRNGTSAPLTITVASQRPAIGCSAARAGAERIATKADISTKQFCFIRLLKTKEPGRLCASGPGVV